MWLRLCPASRPRRLEFGGTSQPRGGRRHTASVHHGAGSKEGGRRTSRREVRKTGAARGAGHERVAFPDGGISCCLTQEGLNRTVWLDTFTHTRLGAPDG